MPTYLFLPSCENMLHTKQLKTLSDVCVNSTRRCRYALSAWDRAISPCKVFTLIFIRTCFIFFQKAFLFISHYIEVSCLQAASTCEVRPFKRKPWQVHRIVTRRPETLWLLVPGHLLGCRVLPVFTVETRRHPGVGNFPQIGLSL